jgi:phage FluMu gp28-like protein
MATLMTALRLEGRPRNFVQRGKSGFVIVDEFAFSRRGSTVADSDGDDGA